MDQVINNWLKNVGSNPKGDPLFRLVWSNSQRELRFGTFNEFYGSIFLRSTTGVKEVPKYPHIQNRWVLEMWQPPELVATRELPGSFSGSYEPIYVFEGKDRKELPLSLRVVELIVNAVLKNDKTSAAILSDIMAEEDRKEEKQFEKDMDSTDTSEILNALHMKEGVGYGVRRN